MKLSVVMLSAMGLCAATHGAYAAQVQIMDRDTGQILPVYRHHGRSYVAGEPGHEYEIHIRHPSTGRILAVTTVDGVNVVTGQTGAVTQRGYVLDSYGFVRIEGWRKSLSRTAAFYFTRLTDSYAARTGRPDNVGVIGVAIFRERVPCCAVGREVAPELDSPRPAAAGRSMAKSADEASRLEGAPQPAPKLGTGHGRSEYSAARYTHFERASDRPDEIITIYYDSRSNLIAQGVIPRAGELAHRVPQPFPDEFVPDP